ncbi:MAG: hypothetical protein WBE14_28755 [Xanthobacteraceae bacterium]
MTTVLLVLQGNASPFWIILLLILALFEGRRSDESPLGTITPNYIVGSNPTPSAISIDFIVVF